MQNQKNNSSFAILSSLTLSSKNVDIVYFISPCHLSTAFSSTRNWIICSAKSNTQTKSTLQSDLFWKPFKMERVDTFMHTKAIRLWKGRNFCVPARIWPTWEKNFRKWILLIIAREQNGTTDAILTKLQRLPFLPSHSKIYPWILKILYCLTSYWKATVWILSLSRRIRYHPIKTTPCLFHTLALHLYFNDKLEEETAKFFKLFLTKSGQGEPSKFQRVLRKNIPNVQYILQLNVFLYDVAFVDEELNGALAHRRIQNSDKSIKLSHYNNRICYISNINAKFKLSDAVPVTHFLKKWPSGKTINYIQWMLETFLPRERLRAYKKSLRQIRKLDAFQIT